MNVRAAVSEGALSFYLQVRQARRRIAGVRNFFRSVERRLTLDANGVSPGPFSLPRRGRHRSQSSAKLRSHMRCFSMVPFTRTKEPTGGWREFLQHPTAAR